MSKTILVHVTTTTKTANNVANAFDMKAAALVLKCQRYGAVRNAYMIAKTRISSINTEGNHINVPNCNNRLKCMHNTNILCWRRVHAQVHSTIELKRLNVGNLVVEVEEVELSPITFATICCADMELVIFSGLLKLNSETASTIQRRVREIEIESINVQSHKFNTMR